MEIDVDFNMNAKASLCFKTLNDLNYQQINDISKVSKDSIIAGFGGLGEDCCKAFIFHVSLNEKLSENEVLDRYDLIEEYVRKIFGQAAEIILYDTKKSLIEHTWSKNESLSIKSLLGEVRKNLTLEFIRRIDSNKHAILLYQNEKSKSEVLGAFFDDKVTGQSAKGMYSVPPVNVKSSTNLSIMSIGELLETDKQAAIRNLDKWIADVHLKNRDLYATTRIAGEDDTWLLESGLLDEVRSIEEIMARKIESNMTILCTYKLSKLLQKNQEIVNAIISHHDCVIIDEPYTAFTRGPNKN